MRQTSDQLMSPSNVKSKYQILSGHILLGAYRNLIYVLEGSTPRYEHIGIQPIVIAYFISPQSSLLYHKYISKRLKCGGGTFSRVPSYI
jgi:hypothetical protein